MSTDRRISPIASLLAVGGLALLLSTGSLLTSCSLLTKSGFQVTDAGTSDAGMKAPGNPGDIAFVAFGAGGPDGFCFVAIVDLVSGREITFTDNNRVSGVFASNENIMYWTATSTVAAGTVVCAKAIDNSPTVTTGALSWPLGFTTMGLGQMGESIFALAGRVDPAALNSPNNTFLAGIATNGPAVGFDLTGTGLVLGQTALDFGMNLASLEYTGARSGQSPMSAYLVPVNTGANWSTSTVTYNVTPFTP